MSGLSPFELGVLRSRMSEGSAGMTLGRSAAWVRRQREALASPPPVDQPADAGAEPVRAESQPHPEAPAPVASAPVEPEKVNRGGRPPVYKPPVGLAEIPPRVLRWARWFIDAHWRYADVAILFDVPEDALRWALSPKPVRAGAA